MERSESIGKLAAALLKVQAALGPIKAEAVNPFFGSRYADFPALIEECRPHLVANGIAVIQSPGRTTLLGLTRETDKNGVIEEMMMGAVELTTMLMHESGEFISDTMSLPFSIRSTQAAGAAISHAKRYGFQALMLIAVDDDSGGSQRGLPLGDADLCPVHKEPWVHRVGVYKEGHAKEGQAYDFWSCPEKAGDKYCQQRPPQGYKGPQAPSEGADGAESEPPPANERIAPSLVEIADILVMESEPPPANERIALLNTFEAQIKRLGVNRPDTLRAWLVGADLRREVKSITELSLEELTACVAWLKEQQ